MTSKQLPLAFTGHGAAGARSVGAPSAKQQPRAGKPQRLFSADLDASAAPALRQGEPAPALAAAFGFMAWRS
jgi:hypothetical protein